MKTSHSRMGRRQALTRLEVVVLILVTLVLILLLLPVIENVGPKTRRFTCWNNLNQIGLSFRIFATDHNDAFPMQVSTNQEGSSEFRFPSEVFRHFQTLSNELGTPKVLVCPEDRRTAAMDFNNVGNSNISYFIGLDAQETRPDVVLSGDSNLTTNEIPIRGGVFPITSQSKVGFTRERHRSDGYVVMSDGSYQQVNTSNLWKIFQNTKSSTNWLAVP